MSNLGNLLLAGGFVTEAKELCDKALAKQTYHKNIGRLLARLNDLPDEEDKTEKELDESTKPKVEFYRSLGQAISRSEPHWQGPKCRFEAKRSESVVLFSGTYEREVDDSFARVLAVSSSSDKRVLQREVEYSGSLEGCAIDAVLVQKIIDGGVGRNESKTKVLMFISEDGTEIKVMQASRHGSNLLYAQTCARCKQKIIYMDVLGSTAARL
jgi:hypothetical protein